MKKLAITIPAKDEEEGIAHVIKGIPSFPKDVFSKVIVVVVDDGSRDKTAEVARKLGAHVISFAANRGLVSAFSAARDYALSQGADIIVNLDADGQHDPADIPRVIDPILKNRADMVIGSRFLGKIRSKSRTKYIGNIMFSKLISVLIKTRITDAQSGFRAYTSEVAKLFKIKKGFTYTQQTVIQAAYHNFKVIEVPITEGIREDGRSRLMKGPFTFAYRAGNLLLTVFAIYYPLKFFGTISFLFMLSGLILGLTNTRNLLAMLLVLIGLQSLFFGLLFEVLNKDRF